MAKLYQASRQKVHVISMRNIPGCPYTFYDNIQWWNLKEQLVSRRRRDEPLIIFPEKNKDNSETPSA